MTKTDITANGLFGDLDFNGIVCDPNFKEDSVREAIILPLLKALGYGEKEIERSVSLSHPYLMVGSKKKPLTLIPDYVLKSNNNRAWVLDAKSPQESVTDEEHIGQAFSYASHPEINTNFFALCNGLQIAIYSTHGTKDTALIISLDELEHYWEKLQKIVAVQSFHAGKEFKYDEPKETQVFDYKTRKLLPEIPIRKQQSRLHYGVHAYFTTQVWNVVAEYIKNFTKPGDVVLDPFCGSGVTAVQSIVNNRNALACDLNPMAAFMTEALLKIIPLQEFEEAFNAVVDEYKKSEPKNDEQIKKALKKYKLPKDIKLAKGSDVNSVRELFSDKQLASLALLKSIIKQVENNEIQDVLMLMFSGLLIKINLTFHPSKKRSPGEGDVSAFRYYRYRMAPEPLEMDILHYFKLRFKKIFSAKKELKKYFDSSSSNSYRVVQGTATDLNWINDESVDYIYTDPPYGKKIAYLDLSAMWNAWLDFDLSDDDFENEAIEGGSHQKSKDQYNSMIAQSIKEMYRVLKYDRWLSFVFAHKDPEFWHLIINSAEACGFEYAGATAQKNGASSFKKNQNPFTVLSGQLIINFKKTKSPKTILKANLGTDIASLIFQTVEGVIAKDDGATLEQINDELILKGLELGFLDLLQKEYSDITPFLTENFFYDEEELKYRIPVDTKFKTKIDIKLRIKYYILSFLRRMEIEEKQVSFDDVVLHIMPLLKNGTTPKEQTILNVLDDIAIHTADGHYILSNENKQLSLI